MKSIMYIKCLFSIFNLRDLEEPFLQRSKIILKILIIAIITKGILIGINAIPLGMYF
jgi:hypothetical protein